MTNGLEERSVEETRKQGKGKERRPRREEKKKTKRTGKNTHSRAKPFSFIKPTKVEALTPSVFIQDSSSIVITINDVGVLIETSLVVCFSVLGRVLLPEIAVLRSSGLGTEISGLVGVVGGWVGHGGEQGC